MPNYRRYCIEGGVFFFTVVTYRRRPLFHQSAARRLLRKAMRSVQHEMPWQNEAMVLLPDHLHMLWRLPPDDAAFSLRITLIKRRFTQAYLSEGFQALEVTSGESRKGYRGVWQPRFWEHAIRDPRDFKMHLDYIHTNPVKHQLAARPADWPWSSFRRYVRSGEYDLDWCGRTELPGSVEYFWHGTE